MSQDESGRELFQCRRHGALIEVPYRMVKKFTITIGDVVREGEESVNDSMLLPASMATEERSALIEQLLDEAEQQEHDAGPM